MTTCPPRRVFSQDDVDQAVDAAVEAFRKAVLVELARQTWSDDGVQIIEHCAVAHIRDLVVAT